MSTNASLSANIRSFLALPSERAHVHAAIAFGLLVAAAALFAHALDLFSRTGQFTFAASFVSFAIAWGAGAWALRLSRPILAYAALPVILATCYLGGIKPLLAQAWTAIF